MDINIKKALAKKMRNTKVATKITQKIEEKMIKNLQNAAKKV